MTQVGEVFARAEALLVGRRTYEDFYSVWPKRTDNPFTPWLNHVPKYVTSHTLTEPRRWTNSTLVKGDPATALTSLKQRSERSILVLGSGDLVQTLMRSHVIDEYVLLIHPLVLGSGRRLFAAEGASAQLTLVSSSTAPNGVIVATYRPVPGGDM